MTSKAIISTDSIRFPDLGLLILFALVLIATGLGLRDPWPADEPRFALMARHMVESGDWFFPVRGGDYYADKPPLFMWLQALFYDLTGSIRVAFLLPSLLAGIGSLVLVHDLARRLWNRNIALHAGILLLLIFQFTLQSRSGQLDAAVSFWICLAMYGLLRHMLLGPAWHWYWLGFFAAGLGVITKGVGVIALLVFIPYALARFQRWNNLAEFSAEAWRWGIGVFYLLLAISLWLVPMLILVAQSGDPDLAAYRDNILFRQTVQRYADSWAHLRPFWYYLVQVIPLFWLPVSALFPWLFKYWRNAWREKDARILLPLLWIVLVVLFFSLTPGKRGVYLTPATTMLALITAPYFSQIMARPWPQRILYIVTALTVAALGAVYLTHVISPEFERSVFQNYRVQPWPLLLVLIGIGALTLTFTRPRQGFTSYAVFLSSFWICFGAIGYPMLNHARSSSELMEIVRHSVPADHELALVGWKEQQLLQAGRPVVIFNMKLPLNTQQELGAKWLLAGGNRHVLFDGKHANTCLDRNQAQFVVRQNGIDWYLGDRQSIPKSCNLASSNESAGETRYDF